MTIDETYNIHKKMNCALPFFKSKLLCKKGIHNYRLHQEINYNPDVQTRFDKTGRHMIKKILQYDIHHKVYWKCHCCGDEIEFEEENE